MTQKPTKKSDQNKKWLKGRESRSTTVKINPEYHLIVTEGTDTEPNYFKAIREEINSKYKDRISLIIEGVGDNTVNLFYKALKIAEKSPNGFKHVWIVYDTDDFPADHINRTDELCKGNTTETTEFHALWSNQCIELWFLLHFGYFQSDIHRTQYWPKLTEYLKAMGKGEYSKGREDMFEILKPSMENAIANAKRLAMENSGKTPALSAPGTEVYRIIEKLKPYFINNN